MTDKLHSDQSLEDQFDAEILQPIEMPPGLLVRVMDDIPPPPVTPSPVDRAGVAQNMGLGAKTLDALGGWIPVSGLTASAVLGIWIGVAPPDLLFDFVPDAFSAGLDVDYENADGFLFSLLDEGA